METQSLSPKRGRSPHQFSAHVYCGQTAGWIKMPLCTKVGLSPVDCVRWGPSPLPTKGLEPGGQTAGCIKMPLGMEVGLGPGDFVLDGDPAPPSSKGGGRRPQIFGPCLMRPNGWMDEAGTWHGGRPQPRRLCVRWGPSPLPLRNFWPISIVAKQLHASKCHLVWS